MHSTRGVELLVYNIQVPKTVGAYLNLPRMTMRRCAQAVLRWGKGAFMVSMDRATFNCMGT